MAASDEGPDAKPISETVEEAASEGLGVRHWDRPAIFRETAEAAASSDLPYWMVLILSGAIATLGLALNSAAVVIGAMLVAPLLAPVTGLALALAVGDGRLALQTAAIVAGSTVAVIAISALLTSLLPFHTVTLEISARTRPSTLDLGIAVFSGLVGAVVTVARGRRLSAAIPGVAISVALIPPLAVAGFGIGSGWQPNLIYGSLLLYGANLTGIVLSGMAIFLLVGMHRRDVVETAIRWHQNASPGGLTALANRFRWVRSVGMLRTAWSRVGMVLLFVAAMSIPLSETLREIAREARVERAVTAAEQVFQRPGRAAVLNRQIVPAENYTQVYLRVATVEWFDGDARDEFERMASSAAGEPVRLTLEQLPTSGGDVSEIATLLNGNAPEGSSAPSQPAASLADLLAMLHLHLNRGLRAAMLPPGHEIVGAELSTRPGGAVTLHVAYAAPDSLEAQAAQMLRRQLQFALDFRRLQLHLVHVETAPRPIDPSVPDTLLLRRLGDLVQRFDSLYLEVAMTAGVSSTDSVQLTRVLQQMSIDSARVRLRRSDAASPVVSVRAVRERASNSLEDAP